MALKLKGSTSGFVGLDAPAVAGNNTLILPENTGSAQQLLGNDITAGVVTFTSVTVNRNGDLTVPGTISIGGTLTYEDVTSIDSVGIITARSTIDAQGDVSIADKIIHTGDTNTAIRFPAADTITAETGGSERLRITSSGVVGINTVGARGATLEIQDIGSTGPCLLLAGATNTEGDLAIPDGQDFNIGHWNNVDTFTERFHITSTGLIGIGTANPLSGAAGARVHIYFKDETTYDSTTNRANGLIINNTASGGYSSLELAQRTTSGNTFGSAIINAVDPQDGNQYGADLTFQTRATGSGSYSEKMRITATGQILLGTSIARAVGGESNPRLHIEGAGNTSNSWFNLTRFQAGTGASNIQFGKSRSNTPGTYTIVQDDDKLGQISFLGADGTDMANYAAKIECFVDGTPGNNNIPGRLTFSTASGGTMSERLRITGGKILMGGTSAYANFENSSTNPRLQVRGTNLNGSCQAWIRATGDAGAPKLFLANTRSTSEAGHTVVQNGDELGGIFFTGSDGSQFVNGAGILSYVGGSPGADDVPGYLSFHTNSGQAATTERMRINANGQIRINDPSGSAQTDLDVVRANSTLTDVMLVKGNVGNGFIRFQDNDNSCNWSMGVDDGSSTSTNSFIWYDRVNSAYRLQISGGGKLRAPGCYSLTTTGGGPLYVESDGDLLRYTSSIKYKTDIETIENDIADKILNCRPVKYKSKCENDIKTEGSDKSDWTWYGFIAEEVAEIEPRLVNWATKDLDNSVGKSVERDPSDYEAEGVRYDNFVPLLVNLAKRQKEEIELLKARLDAAGL